MKKSKKIVVDFRRPGVMGGKNQHGGGVLFPVHFAHTRRRAKREPKDCRPARRPRTLVMGLRPGAETGKRRHDGPAANPLETDVFHRQKQRHSASGARASSTTFDCTYRTPRAIPIISQPFPYPPYADTSRPAENTLYCYCCCRRPCIISLLLRGGFQVCWFLWFFFYFFLFYWFFFYDFSSKSPGPRDVGLTDRVLGAINNNTLAVIRDKYNKTVHVTSIDTTRQPRVW